jgi:hypothetical protein
MRTTMRRLAVALIALLAAPVALHAATNPVVAASKRTAAVKSATLQMNVTTTIPGQGRIVMTGTGAQSGPNVRLSMRTRAAGETIPMDAIMLKEGGSYVIYLRSPAFSAQLPPGKSWLRVDLSKQAATLGIDFSGLLSTTQTFAPLEKGLVSTTRIGRETVAGKPTTHYRAVIDVQRAARALPAYRKQVEALEKATGIRLGRTPYHVWVAGDGRIRRMRFSTPTAAGNARGKSVQTVTFLSFNEPVSIVAPPRAKVFAP